LSDETKLFVAALSQQLPTFAHGASDAMVGHQPLELFADVLAATIDRSDAAAGAVSVWHCINFQQRIGFSEPITKHQTARSNSVCYTHPALLDQLYSLKLELFRKP
jgi:hypothetical protein